MNPSAPPPAALPKRFHSLDVLRGLAALSVVCWHWQHFFYLGTQLGPFDRQRQPFFNLLGLFYLNGGLAVYLFFCLSGFIFFWLYADAIRQRTTSWKEFAALRFSRLYPLHLATLLFVALGQWLVRSWRGEYFVYPYNDPYHFGLQLFLASDWGFQKGNSFNNPAWSISIEVLCYALFFAVCIVNARRCWHLLLFTVAGIVLYFLGAQDLGSGMVSFFSGGLAYYLVATLTRRGLSRRALWLVTACGVLLWIVVPRTVGGLTVYRFYRSHLWRESLGVFGVDAVGFVVGALNYFAYDWLLFPSLIVVLALWEVRCGTLGKRLAWLGDISYSSYLMHFPLQLVFFAATTALAVPNTFYYSPWAMGLFFLVLILLALASYRYFERPCQRWLRLRLTLRPAQAGWRGLVDAVADRPVAVSQG